MSITTKLTLVVALLAGLLIGGAGYTTLVLKESRDLRVVRDHGRLLVSMLKTAAEADLRNHGQLGVIADIVSQKTGQTAVFYGRDGRAIAPVPTDAVPEINLRVRKVIESKLPKETVEKTNKREAYVLRSPLWTGRGLVAGAVELRVDLHDALNRRSWLRPVLIIAGGLMALFVLIIALYANRSMGQPIARLMDGMDAVIRGDLTHTIPLDRNDEIGRIAYRFNEMTARLRAAQDEIRSSAAAKLSLEGSLRRSEKLATIGQLSAEIAHEVGTPLNVIGGRARTLTRKADQPAVVRKNAEIIATQVTRITKIIQQVLDLARAPAQKRESVDLLKVVDDALAFLEYQLAQAEVDITRHYPEEALCVEADPDGMQQIVLNLLLNALQAMPTGGQLIVRAEHTHRRKGGLDLAPPQNYAALDVQDSGVGIPEENRGKVFDPFFSTKAKGEGTGLGLTVVHGIVKAHDGWIDVSSPDEGGTTFSVFLPLAEGENDESGDEGLDERTGPSRLTTPTPRMSPTDSSEHAPSSTEDPPEGSPEDPLEAPRK